MNTNDIKLPPLPPGYKSYEFPDGGYDSVEMQEYALAAIEPYVKRIAELEAARMAYAREFPINEDGEPDVGRIHENIRKLKACLQRRGEPVAWLTPGMQLHLYNPEDFTDWKPLYFAPQPAEPLKECGLCHNMRTLDPAERPAEPVKVVDKSPVPSDEDIKFIAQRVFGKGWEFDRWTLPSNMVNFARALLASYGQPAASAEPVAVIRFERNKPGSENEMPRVISCNRLPDGDYQVFLAPQPQQIPEDMNPTLHAQIITLKKYQAWRTGDDMRTMDEAGVVPKAITSALDAVIAIAEDHLRDATKMKEPVKDADIADVIAGHLQTSRAHAYELMEQALAQRGYPTEPVK